jgi:dolichol-phosphate mannosyltransferase
VRSVFCCPVFDEIRDFPQLLENFRRAEHTAHTLLLINNGSTDGCAELIRDSGHEYLDVPRNRGLGHACMLGVAWALDHGYDVCGIIAGNGKMLPAEMARLLAPLANDTADCVSGSRFLPGGASPNLPIFRRMAIPLVNLWARLLSGKRLTDATCGYRALRLSPLRRAQFDWRAESLWHYGFEFYVYAKYLRDPTLRCVEVPVTMRYPERPGPYSKVPAVTGWWSMLRPWWTARFDGLGFEP